MVAKVISGREVAETILTTDLKNKVLELNKKNIKPKLVVMLVGDMKASASYVAQKEKFAVKAGIEDINVTNEPVEKLPDVKDKLELMKTLNPSKFDRIKAEDEEQIAMQDNDEMNENMLEDIEEPVGFIERRSEV